MFMLLPSPPIMLASLEFEPLPASSFSLPRSYGFKRHPVPLNNATAASTATRPPCAAPRCAARRRRTATKPITTANSHMPFEPPVLPTLQPPPAAVTRSPPAFGASHTARPSPSVRQVKPPGQTVCAHGSGSHAPDVGTHTSPGLHRTSVHMVSTHLPSLGSQTCLPQRTPLQRSLVQAPLTQASSGWQPSAHDVEQAPLLHVAPAGHGFGSQALSTHCPTLSEFATQSSPVAHLPGKSKQSKQKPLRHSSPERQVTSAHRSLH